jgi:hypothetical protein
MRFLSALTIIFLAASQGKLQDGSLLRKFAGLEMQDGSLLRKFAGLGVARLLN